MNNFGKHIIQFFALLLFQVLILNHIRIGLYINPYVYILFIMLLPFATPRWFLLVSAFFTGLAVDWFTATPGLHAGATVFMAFMRPFIIKAVSGSREIDPDASPGLRSTGKRWFVAYSFLLVLLHHAALFFLEVFSFAQLTDTLLRLFSSALFSELIILLLLFFFVRVKK